jgi:hypothetical protein
MSHRDARTTLQKFTLWEKRGRAVDMLAQKIERFAVVAVR